MADEQSRAECSRDRLSRRGFVRAGALTLSGLTLGSVLRLRAEAPTTPRPKSAILIHLSGGPSHLDMYDPKPDAPREYRGEFAPIKTNVPGMELCELMPRQARIADKFAILRGVQLAHLHTANEFYSGFTSTRERRSSTTTADLGTSSTTRGRWRSCSDGTLRLRRNEGNSSALFRGPVHRTAGARIALR